jgi:hypothetical protein
MAVMKSADVSMGTETNHIAPVSAQRYRPVPVLVAGAWLRIRHESGTMLTCGGRDVYVSPQTRDRRVDGRPETLKSSPIDESD